eukprot:Hpha_TRINITY_DN32105_c0_g1::TRINITY_DN32105_c0_g1_i1::g.18403::m.18403
MGGCSSSEQRNKGVPPARPSQAPVIRAAPRKPPSFREPSDAEVSQGSRQSPAQPFGASSEGASESASPAAGGNSGGVTVQCTPAQPEDQSVDPPREEEEPAVEDGAPPTTTLVLCSTSPERPATSSSGPSLCPLPPQPRRRAASVSARRSVRRSRSFGVRHRGYVARRAFSLGAVHGRFQNPLPVFRRRLSRGGSEWEAASPLSWSTAAPRLSPLLFGSSRPRSSMVGFSYEGDSSHCGENISPYPRPGRSTSGSMSPSLGEMMEAHNFGEMVEAHGSEWLCSLQQDVLAVRTTSLCTSNSDRLPSLGLSPVRGVRPSSSEPRSASRGDEFSASLSPLRHRLVEEGDEAGAV